MSDGAREEAGSGEPHAALEEDHSVKRLVSLVVGCILFVASVVCTTLLEGTKGEFGYAPFTPEPLPFAPMRGFTVEQMAAHGARILLATPGLLLFWLATRRGTKAQRPGEAALARWALWVCAASLALTAVFVLFVFRGQAIVDDELVYRMQAEYLSEGHIGLKGLPFLMEVFSIKTPLGFTGKYLFGEPLVQIPSVLLGYPALIHVPIAALTLWLFYRAIRLLADVEIAALGVMLLACSPMFIFTTATAQSQATSLLCVVAAGLGYALATKGRFTAGAALVGMGIGFDVAVRIQVAVPAGAVLVPLTAWVLVRERRFGSLGLLAGLLGFWAALIGWYNALLSGSPFKLPWFLTGEPERFGFGQIWKLDSFRHTPWTAVQNLLVAAVRFNAWWLGWPCSFLAVWLWFRGGRRTDGARPWLLVGFAVLLFELCYYSTGISDTGPIYHYELLLGGALLGANAIREGLARHPASMRALLIAQFGLGWTSFMWEQGGRLNRLAHFIHDDVDAALAKVKPPALLFFETRCSESTARGWVHEALPLRYRAARDPVIAFPRPAPRYVRAYLERFPDRSCWYFHIHPATQTPQVVRCEDEPYYLERPLIDESDMCIWVPSSATRLGLYDPFEGMRNRSLRKKKASASATAILPGVSEPPR